MNWSIFFIAAVFAIFETHHFGWNWMPASDAEVICDGMSALLFALAYVRA